jgi:5,10-methylenetetrahydromethanopterin reductase
MPKFGVEFVPMDAYWKTVYYGTLAEAKGFDYVWITDHYNNRNVYVILTALAMNTEKVCFGPGVTNPYLIHPVMTAQAMESLNELAPNRVVCGIGAGDKTTLDMITEERAKPLSAVREAVEIIRELTTKGFVSYDGIVFKVKGARFNFKPFPIPIFIGAQGPKMLDLATRLADGILINASHPNDFEKALSIVKQSAERHGKDLSKIELVGATSVSIAKDKKTALKAAKPVVAFIVAGAPTKLLEEHGINPEDGKKIADAIAKADWKTAFSSVTNEMYEAFCIAGTPNEVIERIDRLFKIGLTLIIVGSPIGPDVKESIELFSKEVIPHFKV